MKRLLRNRDVFGLLRPAIDVHALGINSVNQLLRDCGFQTVVADAAICEAAGSPERADSLALLEQWIRQNRITRLGFSYRLDPKDGAEAFGRFLQQLARRGLLVDRQGPIASVYFAGLPETCDIVKQEHGERVAVFCGDETPGETLDKIGVAKVLRPREMTEEIAYDDMRMAIARDLIYSCKHLKIHPIHRSRYDAFGAEADHVVERIRHSTEAGLPPLMRAHMGPYLPDRLQAVDLFLGWVRQLAMTGFLDVLSIGTSQLSQANFGEDWGDHPNGGGVPINSAEEFRAVWEAARPMLVRTYAGTKNIPQLAQLYEETINIAWHALSFWWFCQIDGRGPYSVLENLRQHLDALHFIAQSGKPFEPNIPHHFAFRGADDVTYIVSAVLAARVAKAYGIRHLILQNMLNTPKYTWGIQDLAKSRAMLRLVRELEDEKFQVFLQPRAGLDYFSHDLEKAKIQLASSSMLMDDIEPHDPTSPPIIHVLSYSEASHLADPGVINESIQITRAALDDYRLLRSRGVVPDMTRNPEVEERMEELVTGARAILAAINTSIADLYSAEGLYQVFHAGFLPVPYLWEGRDEFERATQWQTQLVRGGMKVVDAAGNVISTVDRAQAVVEMLQGGRVLA